jgi:hypothetical protein
MCDRIARIVSEGLKTCEDLETFLAVKPVVLAFEQTLQVSARFKIKILHLRLTPLHSISGVRV